MIASREQSDHIGSPILELLLGLPLPLCRVTKQWRRGVILAQRATPLLL